MSLASGVGLVSGLDFNQIINGLLQVNARPARALQTRKSLFELRQTSLQNVNKAILDLQNSLKSLDRASDFNRRTVTVGNDAIASATAVNDAAEGSFSLRVLQLAQAERIAAQGVETADQTPIAAGDGVFTFQVGNNGDVRNINVTATTTLTQLRDAINSDPDSDVRASIVNDGSPTNPFRLVLTSSETGAANNIKILNNDTTLNFSTTTIEEAAAAATNQFDGTVASSGTFTGTGTKNFVVKITEAGALGTAKFAVSTDGGLTFGPDNAFTTSGTPTDISGGEGVQIAFGAGTTDFAVGDTFTIDAFDPNLQSAKDAVVEVDGVQIRRSTNTIGDVVEGVTIEALKADASAETAITVRNDNQNANGLIQDFVGKFNNLADVINEATSFDPETGSRGPLFGDSGVKSVLSSLGGILSSSIVGLDNVSIGSIGLELESNGRLSVDNAKLTDALTNDFEAVKRIFSLIGSSTTSGIQFQGVSESTLPGTYDVNITKVAEKAAFAGTQAVDGGGIAQDETLTVTFDGQTIDVLIAAGSTAAEAAAQLNSAFEAEGFTLTAGEKDGALTIESNDFGSSQSFKLVSNRDGASSAQLGVGTAEQTFTGVDVAGTIDGQAATGFGQLLTGGDGTDAEGLEILITAGSPVQGSITVSKGIAEQITQRLASITDETNGLIKTKTDSLNNRIESIDDQLERLNDRLTRQEEALRRQFTNLEVRLAELQSQGNFLLSQLASLSPPSNRS